EGGTGEQVTLEQVNPHALQLAQLAVGFDALGDHLDIQHAAHAENALNDGLAYRIGVDAAHQRHVQFDDVRLELGQQVEPRIAGANVVDGGLEFLPLVLVDDVLQVLLVHQLFAFGDLEDDLLGGEAKPPRSGQGGADAIGGLVHRIRQEVDTQQTGHCQACRQLHGFDATGLVERVAVLIIDPTKNGGGTGAVRATHQCFIGVQAAVSHVDNRLEGHAEVEPQRIATLAG